MKIQEKIKALFAELKLEEQQNLLIELELKPVIKFNNTISQCPHCKSTHIIKHSKYKDSQRFKCKNCNRTFSPTTGTFLHSIKKPELFAQYSKIIKEEGIHTIAHMSKRLNISIPTAFEWRHKLLCSIPKKKDKFDGETQVDDLWFLYSQKGRKGLDFSKQRGGTKRKGDNDFQVKLIAASDKKQVDMKVAKIGRISKADIVQAIGEKFKKNGKLVTDKHHSFIAFAKEAKLEHVNFISSEHESEKGENVQYINNLASRLKALINYKMRGVSTKYLQLYASFFSYTEKNTFDIYDKQFSTNTNAWDVFTNIEKMYASFIKTKSKRTYRCPVMKSWKSQYWNEAVITTTSYI